MSRFALQMSNVQMFHSDLSSEDEENLAIVRVVWAVQSCHLSTQLSRSLAKGAHGIICRYITIIP